jgi:hypothetical protein
LMSTYFHPSSKTLIPNSSKIWEYDWKKQNKKKKKYKEE